MCCCKGCRRISRLCSSLHMLALAFFSSIVLLVAGMLLFPVTIMASDTCASMENVAYKALPNVWPDMCTRDLNGTLSGQTCTFEQAELTLEVDLPGIAGDVLGGCNIGARENRDSPYRSVWNSLRDSMDGQALRNLDTMLEGMEGARHSTPPTPPAHALTDGPLFPAPQARCLSRWARCAATCTGARATCRRTCSSWWTASPSCCSAAA